MFCFSVVFLQTDIVVEWVLYIDSSIEDSNHYGGLDSYFSMDKEVEIYYG